jgi:predicted glycoside hydrolase/deacetylase ChbG (UPF0249 family)
MRHVGPTHSSIRLVINADDFGISSGVNAGIIEAAAAGIVTSASTIVNMPAFADAIDRARSSPALSLGLHLNLTSGRPLTDAPSLTRRRTGEFYTLPQLMARASLRLLDTSDIVRECQAQVDRLGEAGFAPTHLDSHRHVHAHPAIFSAVLRAARSRGIGRVRVPGEPLGINGSDWRATLKKGGLLLCTRLAGAGDKQRRNRISFFGISLQGAEKFAARLFALIPRLPKGISELMVHPGYADASLAKIDAYTVERETELAVLCSREFRELLEQCEVTLISFGDRESFLRNDGELAQHY